ncbi:MAG: alpha-E domain-containing protein [Parvularculaceae bacterium]
MLGKTAGGLFWMSRYLERTENNARLIEAGMRIALTHSAQAENEWASIIATAGARDAYLAVHDGYDAERVVDFLLRDIRNTSSVYAAMETARSNARLVRTALTREAFEAINESWLVLKAALARPVSERDLPEVLNLVRQQAALVRGAVMGTMLRNEIYNFMRLGTFLERADNTARILDVKYYVLLPAASFVGSAIDNIQWEMILRAVSAHRSFRWLTGGDVSAAGIAEFLILDQRMPRSLAFCCSKIVENFHHLETEYGVQTESGQRAREIELRVKNSSIETIFDGGLHEFLQNFLRDVAELGRQIEEDFRFTK